MELRNIIKMKLISCKEFEERRENGGKNLIVLHDNNSEKNYFILITENEKN